MPVIVLLADGVRPDTLCEGMTSGALPNMARLRAEGGLYTVSSCFPSVTGPAYTPFLMGRYPGPLGLPGLRWFDRARTTCTFPDFTRSYVGYQMGRVNTDVAADAPTIFELTDSSLGALSVITRGLAGDASIGAVKISNLGAMIRAAGTHFSGNVQGWLGIDEQVATEAAAFILERRPEYVYAALTGVDKTSHAAGHRHPLVGEALRIIDQLVWQLRVDAERRGEWEDTHLWIASDHGHSPVRAHEDLAGFVASLGHRVVAHPWVFTIAPDVAVMVSGNAMSHLYVELERRERPFWPALAARWKDLAAALLARPSVDLLLLPSAADSTEVHARGRGSAVVSESGRRFSYHRVSGDPLGVGQDLNEVTSVEAHEATFDTDYPDSVVQIARLCESSRCGDMVLSAAREWDFRAKYEPIPHVSSHGALHREHMLVPLLLNHPVASRPRRTVDVMPSTLRALGRPIPTGLDGRPFR